MKTTHAWQTLKPSVASPRGQAKSPESITGHLSA